MSTLVKVFSQYPCQVHSPHLMANNNLTLPVAESTWVPQADRVVGRNGEKGTTGGTPLSITPAHQV